MLQTSREAKKEQGEEKMKKIIILIVGLAAGLTPAVAVSGVVNFQIIH